jgi:putative FmdB family regulatory protein
VPTYQYACTSCGEQLEVMQRFSDDPLTVCPACGGTLRKVFSPVGIVFKGSGFYRTDSRKSTIPSGDKSNGEKSSDKSADKDKVTTKANGSGDGSSAASKSSSDSGSSSSDSSKSADKKPAKIASSGSSS